MNISICYLKKARNSQNSAHKIDSLKIEFFVDRKKHVFFFLSKRCNAFCGSRVEKSGNSVNEISEFQRSSSWLRHYSVCARHLWLPRSGKECRSVLTRQIWRIRMKGRNSSPNIWWAYCLMLVCHLRFFREVNCNLWRNQAFFQN